MSESKGLPVADIDWANDEAVVRAAVPNIQFIHGDGTVPFELFVETLVSRESYAGGWFHGLYEAWALARQHSTVVQFERENNSAYAKPLPEAPKPESVALDPANVLKMLYERLPESMWAPLTREVGPYDVTEVRPSFMDFLRSLFESLLAASRAETERLIVGNQVEKECADCSIGSTHSEWWRKAVTLAEFRKSEKERKQS